MAAVGGTSWGGPQGPLPTGASGRTIGGENRSMEPADLPLPRSLTGGEQSEGAGEFRELAGGALIGRTGEPGRVVLSFRAGVEDQVGDLARRERECCPFLELSVERGDDSVALAIGVGPGADAALDPFYELAAG